MEPKLEPPDELLPQPVCGRACWVRNLSGFSGAVVSPPPQEPRQKARSRRMALFISGREGNNFMKAIEVLALKNGSDELNK